MNIVMQSEAAECGLASLAMIAGHYGHHSDINQLRQQHPQSLKGLNLQQLINIAEQMKLSSRPLKLDLKHVSQLATPCILHWDMNHFVVLEKAGKHKVSVLDPALGQVTYSWADFAEHFTGIALELTPTSQFEKQAKPVSLEFKQLFSVSHGIKLALVQLLFLSLLLQICQLTMPYYMQLTIDQVLPYFDNNLLVVIAIGFTAITVFNLLLTFFRGLVIIHLANTLNRQFAFNLFSHLIRLPLDFFNKRHMGDLISRFGSVDQLKDTIAQQVVEVVIDGFLAISVLVLIFLYHPQLAAVVLISLCLYLAVRMLYFKPLKQVTEQFIVSKAKEQSSLMENIRGIQAIKLFSLESNREGIWQNLFTDNLNQSVKLEKLKLYFNLFNQFIFGIENIVVIYLGASIVINEQISSFSIGMLVAFVAYKGQLKQRFIALVERLIELRLLKLHLQRLADIVLTATEAKPELTYHQLSGELAVDKLSFRYNKQEPWLFEQLSYKFQPGKMTAITGASGIGKSTLLKLLVGLYQSEHGGIQVNNLPMKYIGMKTFRQQTAAVMQDDQLLTGSILQNVSLFSSKIDIERVIQCCKMAAIYHEIMAMPMQLNSLIGDMGTTLSGGQKQRILLARALYQQPRILFLDEATSHLDSHSELLINKALKKLEITRIIIAHRKETIASADVVLQLENGKLTELKHD